jgi:hypothetical protein
MKLTSKILVTMLFLFMTGLFASNVLLKQEFEKVDKSDLYWSYNKILEEPFSHIKIEGGNVTNIAFEPSKNPSVRVSKTWLTSRLAKDKKIEATVKNDTLFLKFPNTYVDIYDKRWLKWNTIVRIFSPQLLSVSGTDTKFEMFKMNQKSINVNLNGKSEFELESMTPQFDTLNVVLKDSSQVVFEMSPDYRASESFHVKRVDANLKDVSVLDVGHAQIDSLKLIIADSSAILLSGSTLKKRQKEKL